MIPTVKKSPFKTLYYIAFLFWNDFLQGDRVRRKRFIYRLLARPLQKFGLFGFAANLSLIMRYCGASLKPADERARVYKYARWMVAIAGLENRDELISWLTDRTRPHIVVLGMGSVGDVLQITPVLRMLKEKIPTARIAVLHRSPTAKIILKNNPYVDTVAAADFHHFDTLTKAVRIEGAADLTVEIRSMSFVLTYTRAPQALRHADFNRAMPESFFQTTDTIQQRWVSPLGYPKPDGKFTWPQEWQHMNYLDVLGMMSNLPLHAHCDLDFFVDPETVTGPLAIPADKPIITVQTGVDADVMNWAHATQQRPTKLLSLETWEQIVRRLTDRGFAVIQLGAYNDAVLKDATLDMRGKTSLHQAALLLKQAFCHIGTEGGLVHLARAMKTKSIVLFGPTSPAFLGYPQNINLTAGDCGACWGATQDWYIYCPRGLKNPECMDAFRVQDVMNAVDKLKMEKSS